MNRRIAETGISNKICKDGLKGPIELTILPGRKAKFDENGVATVDSSVAKILLSSEHTGEGWNLFLPKLEEIQTKPELQVELEELKAEAISKHFSKSEIKRRNAQTESVESFAKQL